jgi:phage-related protein
MVAPLVALGLALSRTQTVTKAAIGGVAILSTAVSGIGTAFKKVFDMGIKFASKAFTFMKDFWTEHIRPLFEPIIGVFETIFSTVGTLYEGFVNLLVDRWEAFKKIVSSLKDTLDSAFELITNPSFDALKTHFGNILTFFETVWDETFGRMFAFISDAVNFDGISNAFTNMATSIASVFNNVLSGVFGAMSSAIDTIVNGLTTVANKIADVLGSVAGTILDIGGKGVDFVAGVIPGGGGGGGGSTDTVAGGGGGHTFNITVNAGGITDRTDKLALAREIASLLQTEVAKNIGATTSAMKY